MTNKKKKPDEDNIDEKTDDTISQSSWIYRLTTTNSKQSIDTEKPPETGNGIWSWLGYSGGPATMTSSSTPDQEQSQEQTSTNSEKHSNSSYWRYFFSSNSNPDIQDSVIISDQQDEDQDPSQQPQEQPQQMHKKSNVVLPSFHSQFQNRITQPGNPSLLSKAINAFSSIFSSSNTPIDSDWDNYIDLSHLIDSMKKDPENIGGKRIVIIGVHGWFPMKVKILQ
jgi:hypothetical protein